MKILLIDDHPTVAIGLKSYLSTLANVSSIDDYDSFYATSINKVKEGYYKIAIVDYKLKGKSGAEICNQIKKLNSKVKTILLTGYLNDDLILFELDNKNINGFVSKQSRVDEIQKSITSVLRDEQYEDAIFNNIRENENFKNLQKIRRLSYRELQIVQLQLLGRKNKEIGNELFISTKTIENHKQNIKEKLEINSNQELLFFSKRYEKIINHLYEKL